MQAIESIISAARANCLLENGDLLSITSFEEYEYFYKFMLRRMIRSYWIGLNCRDSKYVYTWSDGSALTTARWYSRYPVRWKNDAGMYLNCAISFRNNCSLKKNPDIERIGFKNL